MTDKTKLKKIVEYGKRKTNKQPMAFNANKKASPRSEKYHLVATAESVHRHLLFRVPTFFINTENVQIRAREFFL